MTGPADQLPICAPGDAVALGGPRLLDEVGNRYAHHGADVGSLADADPATADLIVLDRPDAGELRSAERALRPGGTIVVRGRPAPGASLSGPDAVLSELRIAFVRDDAN
jgi:hypothetical protein